MSDERFSIIKRLHDNYARLQDLERGANQIPLLPDLVLVAVKFGGNDDAPMGAGERPDQGAWKRACELAAFEHNQGWVRRRSGLWSSVRHPREELDDEELGPPLWGEWASKDGASVHLRPDARTNGLYRFHSIAERRLNEGEPLETGEMALLCQEVSVIESVERDPAVTLLPVLIYYVYWGGTDDDPYAIRRLFTRFAGFGTRDMAVEEPPSAERIKSKRAVRVPEEAGS